MTARPGAADRSWLAGEGFAPVLLERMSPLDVAAFCRRWHDAMRDAAQRCAVALPCRADELPEYERALLRQLDGRRHLRGLASSPLLCAMLCALNLDRRQQLPPDRMALHRDALALLLERRDAEREVPASRAVVLDAGSKLVILQHVAWRLSLAGRAELPRGDVLEMVQRISDTRHVTRAQVPEYPPPPPRWKSGSVIPGRLPSTDPCDVARLHRAVRSLDAGIVLPSEIRVFARAKRLRDLGALTEFPDLRYLAVEGAPLTGGLVAVTPVLNQLKDLGVWSVPTATSLDVLAGSTLDLRDLGDCPFTDLEPLGTLQSLAHLLLRQLPGLDLAPLASLPQLRELTLTDMNEPVDLSPLAQMDRRLRVELRNTPTVGEPGPLVKVRRR